MCTGPPIIHRRYAKPAPPRARPQRGSVWEGIQRGAGCGSNRARLQAAVNWTAPKVSLGNSRGPASSHRTHSAPRDDIRRGAGRRTEVNAAPPLFLQQLEALTHHSDCRSSAEKAVGPIWSWPVQHVQSNTDGLKKVTDGFDDGRSHTAHTGQTQVTELGQGSLTTDNLVGVSGPLDREESALVGTLEGVCERQWIGFRFESARLFGLEWATNDGSNE